MRKKPYPAYRLNGLKVLSGRVRKFSLLAKTFFLNETQCSRTEGRAEITGNSFGTSCSVTLSTLFIVSFCVFAFSRPSSASAQFPIVREPSGPFQKVKVIRLQNGFLIRDLGKTSPPALNEEQLLKLKVRIEHYLAAQKNWVEKNCELSTDESSQLQGLMDQQWGLLQLKFKDYSPKYRDILPVTFIKEGLPPRVFNTPEWNQQIEETLSNKNAQQFRDKIREREQRLLRAEAEYLYQSLNSKLYILPSQRAALIDFLSEHLRRPKIHLYSWEPDSELFKYESMNSLLDRFPKESFTEAQLSELKRLTAPSLMQPEINFDTGKIIEASRDEAYNQIDYDNIFRKTLAPTEEKLKHHLAARFEHISEYTQLDQSQRNRLQLARNGIVIYLLEKLSRETQVCFQIKFELLEKRDLGEVTSLQHLIPEIPLNQITSHPVYLEALNSLGNDYQSYQNQLAHSVQTSQLDYLITILDRELWLNSTQRAELISQLTPKFEHLMTTPSTRDREIQLAAIAVRSISDSKAQTLLNPTQLKIWHNIKSKFILLNEKDNLLMLPNGASIKF